MKNTENIVKLVSGNLNSESRKDILARIDEEKDTKEIFQKVKVAWALLSSTKKMPEYKVEKSYLDFQSRILTNHNSSFFKTYSYFKYAAIFILLLSIPALIIYLNDRSANETKYTTLIADYGQMSRVMLPDSSVVWLNSGSTLIYNNNYSVKNRDLKLKGQAFFDIRKDKKNPLIVSCNNFMVKVMGTKFDVSAYPEDTKIRVTLKTGKVELLHKNIKSFSYLLSPGEMAEYDTQLKNIMIKEIEVENYINWKDGVLIFKDTPMAEVIKQLNRKFNVKIEVKNSDVYKSIFNANFNNEKLPEILDYIQYTCSINYEIVDENSPTKIVLY
jgi:ferric-dicitrate binding protein FerR (iron transport regulator)